MVLISSLVKSTLANRLAFNFTRYSADLSNRTRALKMEKRPAPVWIKPQPTPGVELPKLKLYNSLTQDKEEFVPLSGKRVLWYGCGPTVYDASHMGHARCYISTDIIRRVLMHYFHYDVYHVMNITDIDDKIIKRARQNHLYETYCAESKSLELVRADIEEALQRSKDKLKKETDKDKRDMHQREVDKITNLLQKSSQNEGAPELLKESKDCLSDWLDSKHGHTVTDNAIFVALPEYWEMRFHQDMRALNILPADTLTRVREFIPQIIKYVEKIVDNGFAYESNGSVYFDTSKFASDENHYYAKLVPTAYGDTSALAEGEGEVFLSATNNSGVVSGSVAVAEKRSPTDFALWKASKAGEPAWDSPWGRGRPGWHIECSVMASETLGERMDIHSGGVDLKFPHHDNELAQSEAYFQHSHWVNYFLHSGHLTIAGCKMSKSLKNFITIGEALEQYTSRRLRLAFLLHSWKDTLDYGPDTMQEAAVYDKLLADFFFLVNYYLQYSKTTPDSVQHCGGDTSESEKELNTAFTTAQQKVCDALCDSIDTREALSAIRELINAFHSYTKANPDASTLSQPVPILLRTVQYITWLMRVFGCDFDVSVPAGKEFESLSPPFGFDLARWDAASSSLKLKQLLDVVGQFQQRVQQAYSEAGDQINPIEESLTALMSELQSVHANSHDSATYECVVWQPLLDKLASLRDQLRRLSLDKAHKGTPLSKALLMHSDWLRNEALVEIGVRLEDRDQGPAVIALVDRRMMLEEKAMKAKMENEKRLERERLITERAQKEAEKAALAKIAPQEMFRSQTNLYSQFDANGIPTHNAQNEEISKGQRKKLEKAFNDQKKRHEQYLASQKN